MKNAFIKSTGGIVINDNVSDRFRNVETDERVIEAIYRDTVLGDRNTVARAHVTKSVCFLRPGPLRYLKQDELMIAHPDWRMREDGSYDQYYEPSFTFNSHYHDLRRYRRYYYGPGPGSGDVYSTAERATTFAALGFMQADFRGIPQRAAQENAFFPNVYMRWPMVSWIDIPGTQIGNIFPHPPGRSAWFNEVGQTALSQGAIEIEGVYDPPENMLQHNGYQVYYTKTGGTGRPGDPSNPDLTAAIDGVAGSVTTSSDTFTDGAAQGLFLVGVHDQGNHYIRIQSGPNRGTYLITSVTDVNNVVVDATAINEPFTTESSIAWEMVSGPVGEYFWRRRPEHSYEYWSSSSDYNYGSVPLSLGMYHEIDQCWDQRTPAMATLHDRGGCWWGCMYRSDSVLTEGRLFRWVHMSPQAFEPMNDPTKWSGSWPVGLSSFTGMCIDDQNKIWLAHRSDNATKNGADCVLRFDSYPGGNSLTPQFLSSWDRQANAADASGLVSSDCWGILADNSQVYAPNTRIWVANYLDEQIGSAAGFSYTDDYGATWKRLHLLTSVTGTASVSVGTGAVTGVGTAFTTEFAVGDWIRFAGDTRSYEITAIADDLNLTISPNHATGVSAVAIQRGALAADQDCIYAQGGVGSSAGSEYQAPAPFDWDSDGNLYWINFERTKVLKWDESAGQVSEVTTAQLSTSQTITSGTQLHSLTVQRVPNPHGVQDHPLHNVIWIGTASQGTAAVFPVFDGSHCRYHWNNANNWPTTMDFPVGTDMYGTGVVVEPTTGQAYMSYQYSNGLSGGKFSIQGHYNGQPNTRIGLLVNNGSSLPIRNITQISQVKARLAQQYSDLGLGYGWYVGGGVSEVGNGFATSCGLDTGFWICHRWNGSSWVKGPVNNISSHLYFDGVSDPTYSMPNIDYPVSLGAGVRRMHPYFDDLDPDYGMRIRFADSSPQSTAQDQQFLVDEQSTFMCYVGRGKDNTQEARYFVDMHNTPTVLRENYETLKTMDNMWSQDGGIDGGHTTSSNSASFPSHTRGVAEYDYYSLRGGYNSPYDGAFFDYTWNTPGRYKQWMASLRIRPEGEFAADGSTTAASPNFVTAGAHTFVPGDIGKSIIVEGVNGATPDADNGQAVILSWVSGTEVVTDKTFAATNGSLRWKLMDIPPVSYVVGCFENMRFYHAMSRADWRLYSSNDRGVSWVEVKHWLHHNGSTPNAPDWTALHDPGVYMSDNTYMRGLLSASTDPTGSYAIVFDLTDLPENVRRRQHWKIYSFDELNNAEVYRFSSIHLLDDSRKPMGVPTSCKADDTGDAAFDGFFNLRARQRVWTGTNNAVTVDDGDGDNYTDQISMPGENFYLQTGVNNAQLSGNDFIGGAWVPEDVGKFIRVANAVNPANNGWALVTAYVGAGQVTTDKAFTAETNTFDWQVTWVGENDYFKMLDANYTAVQGQQTNLAEFSIADVPSASTLLLTAKDFPVAVSGHPFVVNRNIVDGGTYGNSHSANATNVEDLQRVSQDPQFGMFYYSRTLEFITLEEDLAVASATTGADDDGDGRVDTVILPVTLVAEAVAGDYLMLDGTGGRRIFEIASISRDDPGPGQTTVVVTYDEVFPSGTFTWSVYRRRGLQYDVDRGLYFLTESLP